ncbi:MAG TPA: Rieske 2Fe-2S domain-containing protein [Mycobacteriales bacterium]|nr:Rieske 2Fe-2S domain-containing protein [Mycobacteriales bacterium]
MLTGRLEQAKALDPAADVVSGVAGRVLRKGPVKDLLHGTWLGHPVHPLLIAVPIGFWSGATLLDLTGQPVAARRLVGAGVLAAGPTAATGMADYSELGTAKRPKRVGLVHAVANWATIGVQLASWRARSRGEHVKGAALSLAAMGGLAVGGYLGGHLAYSQAVGVNRNADVRLSPRDWADVAADADVVEGQPLRVTAAKQPVVLVRRGGVVHALGATCSHWGGPLDEGSVDGDCIVCPWHGSAFRLADAGVVRGPATSPQPLYDVRVVDGRVQVRARAAASQKALR